jgi:hypothetical protein
MSVRHCLLGLLVSCAFGCPPPGNGPGPIDGPIHAVWEEDSDNDNNFPTDAEPVSVVWTGSVTIEGSMSDCGFDADELWPWTGDEDNYLVEAPADGYLDVTLTWEHNADLDLLIYFEEPGGPGTISPDEQLAASNDNGVIEYLFDNPNEEGDKLVFTVLCASGPNGDYSMRVGWED